MMRSTIAAAVLAAAAAAPGAARANPELGAAQAEITWLAPDLTVGGGPGERPVVGPLTDYLGAHWGAPQRVLVANAKRSWSLIRAGEPACHLMALRTPEREEVAHFVNTHLVPPAQLVAQRQSLPQLPLSAAGEVDLERLWQQVPRLKGALIEGRSYGQQLDRRLAQRPLGAMDLLAPADFGTRILQMVAAGRLDYALDYDFSLQQQKQQQPALQDLVALPLQGASDLQVSGVACPRNAWGARVAKRLRQLLAAPAGIAALKASFDPSLTPQVRARYGARIAAYYDQLPAELARSGD